METSPGSRTAARSSAPPLGKNDRKHCKGEGHQSQGPSGSALDHQRRGGQGSGAAPRRERQIPRHRKPVLEANQCEGCRSDTQPNGEHSLAEIPDDGGVLEDQGSPLFEIVGGVRVRSHDDVATRPERSQKRIRGQANPTPWIYRDELPLTSAVIVFGEIHRGAADRRRSSH